MIRTNTRKISFFVPFRELSRIVFGSVMAAVPDLVLALVASGSPAHGQSQDPVDDSKKTNVRPAEIAVIPREPFDGVAPEKMAGQCVTLDTEAGTIVIEMIPEVAPESVRNFAESGSDGCVGRRPSVAL